MESRSMYRALAVLVLCCVTAASAALLRPDTELRSFPEQKLEQLVPTRFGNWRVDTSIVPVLPDPGVMAAVDRIYSDTLARTYINDRGERIMLSLAYGRRQDDTMRLHQPEGCYGGQGFGVKRLGADSLHTQAGEIPVMRLYATLGQRREPITYWMVVGGRNAVTQWQGKVAQLSFGMRGYIPDGLLVRVSSISGDPDAAYKLHQQFMDGMLAAVPTETARALSGQLR